MLVRLRDVRVPVVAGIVLLPNGEAPHKAVVEIYKFNKDVDELLQRAGDYPHRLTACVADGRGRFAFHRLPKGKYLIRAGTADAEGLNAVDIVVTVAPGHSRARKRKYPVVLTLTAGT